MPTRLGTVGKTTINKVYDPACDSGSLLLKAEKVLGRDAVTNGFYGQEINITTYNLCRINMFLYDVGFDKFDIACGKKDNAVLFIEASKECIKVTNNNRLTQENIDHIVDAFAKREDIPYFCRLTSYEEVKENDYNLSISTYVEAEDTREKVDIAKLNAEIEEIVAREQVLREEIDKIIAEIEADEAKEKT